MGQLPSPYEGKEPTHVDKKSGKAYFGTLKQQEVIQYKPVNPDDPRQGVTAEVETIVVGGDESVDLKTGQSDSKYWQPEKVMDPTGCIHVFIVVNIGKREIECTKNCGLVRDFHPGVNFKEEHGKMFLIDKGIRYPILPINSPIA